jgi:hypothetical protein
MQVMLETCQLRVAVNDGMQEREVDCTAMECLLWSFQPDMVSTLAVKERTNDAWEAMKLG